MSDRRPRSSLVLDVLAYALARLLLVVVLTAVIFGAGHLLGVRDFPLVVALLFALVIALPLGIWIFAPLRRRATASIAVVDERRRKDREQLQARLRGEETSGASEATGTTSGASEATGTTSGASEATGTTSGASEATGTTSGASEATGTTAAGDEPPAE